MKSSLRLFNPCWKYLFGHINMSTFHFFCWTSLTALKSALDLYISCYIRYIIVGTNRQKLYLVSRICGRRGSPS